MLAPRRRPITTSDSGTTLAYSRTLATTNRGEWGMKRRYVVAAVIASSAILAGGVVGAFTFKSAPSNVSAASEPDPTPEPEPGVVYDVPDWVREQSLYSLQQAVHLEGKPEEVYGVATTTVARLVELEPNTRSAVKLNEKTKDDPIYAVFVRGEWGVVSPPTWGQPPTEMEYDIVAGRALLDKKGLAFSIQAWHHEKPARPAFGEQFDTY
jgi:hypothetical protein